ncbi:lasso peptide biosynthesis PqqD family chaperone [Paenibacillus polysaccharolyticus]|uniref:lasso peptide biosynthesis PqqD family chaperone n=1 Tax=Paenibacillus polysaccharolyticus TaxID=582692 RepID=UPI0020420782|nr:lasso peptide biosynthesis PqqD family chaperone [Paenibacillus polysaccharolyticus]MCM3131523.1 lasso peptide biosynthesis PqqD family chaperone [Paenibacillus polysaccharolyticus]
MTAIKPIYTNDVITRKEGNLVSDMAGEKVMMSIASGKYYNLGSTGGRIWELIAEERTLEELIETLAMEYDIGPDECREQVISFLEHLSREGLIHISSGV